MLDNLDDASEELANIKDLGQSIDDFYNMGSQALETYERRLKTFSEDFVLLKIKKLWTEEELKTIQKIESESALLKKRLEDETRKPSRKLGIKRGNKSETQKENERLLNNAISEEEKQKFTDAYDKIQKERNTKIRKDFSEPTGILESAIAEFRQALIPPLLASDVIELERKQEALDKTQAAKDVSGVNISGAVGVVKRFSTSAALVIGELAEETTGGVFKATALFLAWPLILPIKVANQGFTAAKYGFCAADGFLGFFDKSLDKILPVIIRDSNDKIQYTVSNMPNIIPHAILRGPILIGRGICQIASIGARFLEKNIDSDKWMKKAPITAGFSIGGVGTAVVIAVALASIPGLGIPIAMLGVGFAVATVGALAQGYFKSKKRAEELKTLQLESGEAAQLAKYEYEHNIKNLPKLTISKNNDIITDITNQNKETYTNEHAQKMSKITKHFENTNQNSKYFENTNQNSNQRQHEKQEKIKSFSNQDEFQILESHKKHHHTRKHHEKNHKKHEPKHFHRSKHIHHSKNIHQKRHTDRLDQYPSKAYKKTDPSGINLNTSETQNPNNKKK